MRQQESEVAARFIFSRLDIQEFKVTCLVFSSQFHLETLAPVVDSDFHCDTNSNGVWYSRLEWGRTAL